MGFASHASGLPETSSLIVGLTVYAIALCTIIILVADMASGLRISDGIQRAWERRARLRARRSASRDARRKA